MTVKLMTLIKTVAQMREAYPVKDSNTFIDIKTDELRRLPRIELYYIDDERNLEVTLSRVIRREDEDIE